MTKNSSSKEPEVNKHMIIHRIFAICSPVQIQHFFCLNKTLTGLGNITYVKRYIFTFSYFEIIGQNDLVFNNFHFRLNYRLLVQ